MVGATSSLVNVPKYWNVHTRRSAEDPRLAERKLPARPLLFREAPEFRGIRRRGTAIADVRRQNARPAPG
jgi:hypothetical protein